MRSLNVTILILLFSPILVSGQRGKLEGYKLVLGKYVFKTETKIETEVLNGNVPREYSYLFKNEKQIIKIPKRVDKVSVSDISDPTIQSVLFDTVEQFQVHKIVDTISIVELKEIINSEIKLYSGDGNLKFDEAHLETIQPTGKTSYTIDLQKPMIKDGSHAFKETSALGRGGYLILRTIWFYDIRNHRQEIECNIAWFIE